MSLLSFLFTLRSNPEYISLILNNCKNVEFYQPLSYFVVDSIFTDCFLEKESYEEISFIMDKTLEKEINSIPSIDNIDMFLSNNSINFFLIKALMIKNDIQNYMCLILKDLIQEVSTYSNLILTLDLQYINSLSLIPKSYLSQNSTDLRRFGNYMVPFTKEMIINEKENCKTEKMKKYCDKLLQSIEDTKNENLFSNELFLLTVYNGRDPKSVLEIYQIHFMLIIHFLERLIDKIKSSVNIIPLCIKYIAKLISKHLKKEISRLFLYRYK